MSAPSRAADHGITPEASLGWLVQSVQCPTWSGNFQYPVSLHSRSRSLFGCNFTIHFQSRWTQNRFYLHIFPNGSSSVEVSLSKPWSLNFLACHKRHGLWCTVDKVDTSPSPWSVTIFMLKHYLTLRSIFIWRDTGATWVPKLQLCMVRNINKKCRPGQICSNLCSGHPLNGT